MDIVKVILTSILSVLTLFTLTKLIGNQQLSQLTMFDYINGITIGSIAAELATALETDYRMPLIAMVVYAAAVILINLTVSKSTRVSRFINGRTEILFERGSFCRGNMKRAQVDVSEFMAQLRIYGCFDLSQLEYGLLEPNGRISFLLKSDSRPISPSDMGLKPKREGLQPVVILDGEPLEENLRAAGRDNNWLSKELARLKVSQRDVMLAEINSDGALAVYTTVDGRQNDMFQ